LTGNTEGKQAPFLGELLFRLYGIFKKGYLRKKIILWLKKLEGGELHSVTLRRIYSTYYDIHIGLYTYGGCFNMMGVDPKTTFGRYCSIAERLRVFGANHPMNFKSMHPLFYHPAMGVAKKDLLERTSLEVGSDVWIGYGVVILPSVNSIGHGAVIGAGSVVTKDVPPYAIVAGQPAKLIRYRFSEERIEQLLASRWWEKSIEELLPDIEEFQKPIE
jgi:acetyltransferase-like isoleucine patch superfamily enzyme